MDVAPNGFFCLYSQNPTADEVLSWSQNFDKMMKAPAGRNLFREFLRTEYSEENLLFWLACEDLKSEQNKKVVEEKARMIYEDYISILSPKEVRTWRALFIQGPPGHSAGLVSPLCFDHLSLVKRCV